MRRLMFLFLVFFSIFIVTACGSDGDDGKDGVDGKPGITTPESEWTTKDYKAVTNLSCIGCHAGQADQLASPDYTLSKMSAAGIAANGALAVDHSSKYLFGPHARAAMASTTYCGACHQSVGQQNNEKMLSYLNIEVPLTAKVGGASCIDCHGVENGHYARTTIEITNSGGELIQNSNVSKTWDSCFQCHANDTNHNPSHGDKYFGRNLGNAYMDGNHGKGYAGVGDAEGNIREDRVCGYCHTDGYARQYNDFSGSKTDTEIETAYATKGENTLSGMANTGIGCGTCHDSHTGGLKSDNNAVASKTAYSSEFLLCTSCHMVMLDDPVPTSNGRNAYFLDESIYSTVEGVTDDAGHHFLGRGGGIGFMGTFVLNHFTTQSGNEIVISPDGAKGLSAGYNIDAGSRKPCSACHDPHQTTRFAEGVLESGNSMTKADLRTLGDSFAKSGHADYSKDAWSASYIGDSCMPCHNGREATKYMEGYSTRMQTNVAKNNSNAFSGMQASYKQSTSCGTCHELTAVDTRAIPGMLSETQAIGGAVRMKGDTTFILPGSGATDVKLNSKMLKAMSDSNTLVCYTCHGGRSTLESKKNEYAALATGVVPFGITPHHAPTSGIMGGTLLPKIKGATVGIVETRFDYDNNATWPGHFNNTKPTCVQCHDINSASHTFAVYKDADDNPVWIGKESNGDAAVDMYITGNELSSCNSCHAVPAAVTAKINHFAYKDTVDFLWTKLQSDLGVTQAGRDYKADWKDATNDIGFYRYLTTQVYVTLMEDPGGYAHGEGIVKDVVGESLKKIYDLGQGVSSDPTGFQTWMNTLSSDARQWLCGGTNNCNIMYNAW